MRLVNDRAYDCKEVFAGFSFTRHGNGKPPMSSLLAKKRLWLAKLELERERMKYRKHVRDSFLAFVRHMRPEYKQARFQLELIQVLQDIGDGKIDRAIVSMPPRHTKSEHCSRLFPAWLLGRNPNGKIMATSYNDDMATDFNRSVQEIMDSPRYREVFPNVRLPSENTRTVSGRKLRNNTIFEILNHIGSYFSAGIMGGLTGKGATIGLIIDDPTKNASEAESPAIQAKLEKEWKFTIRSRIEKGAFCLIIMTRWLQNDFAGMRLADAANSPQGQQWKEVRFSAVKDDPLDDSDPREIGETLWPEGGYDKEWARLTRIEIGEDAWNAQNQQRPVIIGGGILKTFKLKFWYHEGTEPPPFRMANDKGELVEIEQIPLPAFFGRMLQSWDMTFKMTKTGSFIAGGAWGTRAPECPAMAFLLDQVLERGDFSHAVKMVKDFSATWPMIRDKYFEDKANGPAIQSHLQREIPGIQMVQPFGSKLERAHTAGGNLNAGNVVIPHPSIYTWVKPYLGELAAFPKGAHDDQVDQTTQALNIIYGTGAWKVY
jgi:predicted phage terminase large subunit-like protein